ncbi:hypothetical protein AMTR_s00008p00166140 [Amborella trichopoda]|uniref:Uncharacterized protein n=1 Tax=Amborella trichopoda TaxID=13333 RepID=W1NJD9_AMBTC|nr:hypothetical protein AMTR_s00008p00166140 [Amborella trichopoda]
MADATRLSEVLNIYVFMREILNAAADAFELTNEIKECVVEVIGEASFYNPIIEVVSEASSSNDNAEVVGEASIAEVVGVAYPNGEDLSNPRVPDHCDLLDSYLLPSGADSPEGSVFYLKMKIDFFGYLPQLMDDNWLDNNKRATDEAHLFY